MSTSSNKIAKIKAEAYDLVKDEIGKLSGIKKFLFETLFSRLFDIFTEDCSDNDLAQAINSIEKVNSEYVREDDFLNYDSAMRILHYSSNRVGFSNLMKKKGIKQHKFRNQKIGFKKSEILVLEAELAIEREKTKKEKNIVRSKTKRVEKPKLSRMEKLA